MLAIAVDDLFNVYSTGYDNVIYKIDSVGDMVWSYSLSESGHSISVDSNNEVHIGLNDGTIVKLTSVGALSWDLPFGSSRISGIATFPLVGAFSDLW